MGAEIEARDFGLSKREIADLLRDHGINPTTQRIEIAHYLMQKPQHVCADMILNELNRDYEIVSQATVYNTMKLLVEKGVVSELIFAADRIYYDSRIDHHHHFVDIDSGEIIDLPEQVVEFSGIDSEIGESEIISSSVIIRGRRTTQNTLKPSSAEPEKKRSALKSRRP